MEAFANDACRTVAAQVSEAVGFNAMTQSTADTLAEVLASYIEEVMHASSRQPPRAPATGNGRFTPPFHRSRCRMLAGHPRACAGLMPALASCPSAGGPLLALADRGVEPDPRQRARRAASPAAMRHVDQRPPGARLAATRA
jgi:hypothetical protein